MGVILQYFSEGDLLLRFGYSSSGTYGLRCRFQCNLLLILVPVRTKLYPNFMRLTSPIKKTIVNKIN